MDLYFSIGIPEGYTEMLDGVTFAPVLLSVNTVKVSESGTKLQAVVKGMGVKDEITLIDAASLANLCVSSKMLEYGVLECDTDPAFDFSAGPIQVSVKEVSSGAVHACKNSDLTKC